MEIEFPRCAPVVMQATSCTGFALANTSHWDIIDREGNSIQLSHLYFHQEEEAEAHATTSISLSFLIKEGK